MTDSYDTDLFSMRGKKTWKGFHHQHYATNVYTGIRFPCWKEFRPAVPLYALYVHRVKKPGKLRNYCTLPRSLISMGRDNSWVQLLIFWIAPCDYQHSTVFRKPAGCKRLKCKSGVVSVGTTRWRRIIERNRLPAGLSMHVSGSKVTGSHSHYGVFN